MALYRVPEYTPVATFGGHMHWYQRTQTNSTTQFVIGNSGTKLIDRAGVPRDDNLNVYFRQLSPDYGGEQSPGAGGGGTTKGGLMKIEAAGPVLPEFGYSNFVYHASEDATRRRLSFEHVLMEKKCVDGGSCVWKKKPDLGDVGTVPLGSFAGVRFGAVVVPGFVAVLAILVV